MKAHIKFTFDLPEESEAMDNVNKAQDLKEALYDFYQNTIRKRIKYCEHPECCHDLLEKIKEEFFQELSHRGIEL